MKVQFSSSRIGWGFVILLLLLGRLAAEGATPASGTVSGTSPAVSWTAGPFLVANVSGQAGDPNCGTAQTSGVICDNFTLTIAAAAGDATTKRVRIDVTWPGTQADFDLYVFQGTTLVAKSAGSTDPETVFLPATSGTFTVRTAPFNPIGQSITGTAVLEPIPPAPPQPAGIAPRFQNYAAPTGLGEDAGEPSIGIDWNVKVPALKHDAVNTGGVAFFTSGPHELRASFDDCSSPAAHAWDNVSSPYVVQSVLSDPIGWVDRVTGRVFALDLLGGQGNSFASYSDTDGNGWLPSQGGGVPAGPDHETLGGGPFATPAPLHPLYPNAIYYCSQNIAGNAECSLSLDGGQTFGPGVPIFPVTQCVGGIHGHVKVSPDGTVYVPNSTCSTGVGSTSVALSRDNGTTWTVKSVPGSTGNQDPSVGVAADNTVYIGWSNGDGHPYVAVSHDHGTTWTNIQDVGGPFGIQGSVFPVVVAGDKDRAAFGFLGTPTGGNFQDAANFKGIWHFYVATTYDGGVHWYLTDATPNDPVQVGSICLGGLNCGTDRNLLDFNDVTIDKEGRVVAAYADGCVAGNCSSDSTPAASRSKKATILRQSGGRRLLSAYDPVEPAKPGAPRLESAARQSNGILVKWSEPDNGASALTAYKVYRGTASGAETLLATIDTSKTTYLDTTAGTTGSTYYKVSAANAVGESASCRELVVTAGPSESPCTPPGLTVVTDPSSDQTGSPANAALDIRKVSIAELFPTTTGNDQLTFTMKVGDLSVLPPQARWTIFFSRANGSEQFVDMTTSDTANPTGVAFHYGHTTAGAGGVRNQTTDGAADSGSFAADGTITIKISNSKLTFNTAGGTLPPPAAGEQLINVNGFTQQQVGILLAAIDTTGSGSYIVSGNQACNPGLPVARDDAATTVQNTMVIVNVVANDDAGGFPPLTVTSVGTPSSGTAANNGDGTITYAPALNFTGSATFSYTIANAKGSSATANVTVTVTSPNPAPPQCSAPGVTVATDAAGDQTGGAANTQMDILKIQMAESYANGGVLSVTMTTSALDTATMPPNGTWRTSFNAAHADNSTTTYFVSVNTNSASNPTGISFNYGFVDTTGASPISRTVGSADGGSLDTAKKTLTVLLLLDKLKKPVAGGATGATLSGANVDLSAGKSLTAIGGATQLLIGVLGNGSNQTIDSTTSTGSYTFAGIGACPAPPPPPPPPPPPASASARYQNYTAPNGVGTTSGEPSIGTNWFTGRAFYLSGLVTLRITFDDCVSPARTTWENKSPLTSATTTDPIMFTDHFRKPGDLTPNRTIVSQLAGTDSLSSLTDDDGETWIPNQGGAFASGVDHQTIGAGPFHTPLPANPTYPNAVYYCSQDLVNALCALSLDGGLTYGPPVPIYTSDSCGGIHGHVKVAPDGTVYVPNKTCSTSNLAAVVVSKDNGITWAVKTVPNSGTTGFLVDPSLGIGADGTVYFGWQHADGHARVAVSHDQGDSWTNNLDVGAQLGVNNMVFPAMVAGDKDRAAFAFLGSTTAGNYTDPTLPGSGFHGMWHLYISQTLDGGVNWSTVDATPNDPVQRGSICTLGTTACAAPPVGSRPIPDRNLLDFMDVTIDGQGRVLVGYADGCITPECINGGANDYVEKAVIARQSGGKRLLSVYDPAEPVAPGAPQVTALRGPAGVHLTWPEPDNGGAPIASYNVYRRNSTSAPRVLLGSSTTTSYDDTTADQTTSYLYSVGAVNAAGESAFCSTSESTPVPAPDPCHLPGVSLVTDPAGDATTTEAAIDIRELSIAEPDPGDGPDNLVWTLRVASLATIPANRQWYVIWDFGSGLRRYVAAKSDANGALSYEYGHVGPPLSPTAPDPDANRPFREGAAVGVVDQAHGTFTIAVLNSNVGSPAAGQTLGNISPRTFAGNGNVNVTGSTAADTTITPSYTLAGNLSCSTRHRPTAHDDAATTQENTAVTIAVLANDSDGGAPPLAIASLTQPANGVAGANADGTITYNPRANVNGSDGFTYTVRNGDGLTATAAVTITIPAFCPYAPTGSFSDTFEPDAKPGWTKDTATNQISFSPTWQVITDPLAHSSSHSFYTDGSGGGVKDDRLVAPPQNISATTQLIFWHRYQYEDGFDGGVIEVSTDGGATWNDVGLSSFAEGGYNGTISPSDSSPIAGRKAWTGGNAAAAMTRVVVNLGAFAALNARVRFRSTNDPLGPGVGWFIDDVQFTNTNVATTCNHPPKAANDIASTVEDHDATIDVLANDSDPDGNPISVTAVTQPSHGSVTTNGANVTYSPAHAYSGNDSFTYTISDNGGLIATATVSVTVSERPNAPPTVVLTATPSSGDAPLATMLSGAGSSDPDAGDAITAYTFTFGDGSPSVTQSTPTIAHTYANAGSYTATLVVRDMKNASSAPASATITVTQPNHAPVAKDDAVAVEKSSSVSFNVLANDSDPDGDALTVTSNTLPPNGSLTNNGGGNFTYSPANGFKGTDSFSYTISDGHGHTASANVTIDVTAPGNAPNKASGGGTIAGASFTFNADSKPSGRISYTAGALSMKGTVTSYTPGGASADFGGSCSMSTGNCTFTAHATDGAPDRFSIKIYDTNGVLIHQNDGALTGGDITIK